MPKIPYLTGGESLTAAQMNALTEEASNRASLALDNHSILFLQNESGTASREDFTPYLGPVFTFGTVRLASYWSRFAYDHSVFTSAVAAAALYSGSLHTAANESRKWFLINPLPSSYWTTIGRIKSGGNIDWRMSPDLFRFSLEAHRRLYTKEDGSQELFWIYETFNIDGSTDGSNAHPTRLCRINTLTQAELVFEGVTGSTFDFPYEWNRFQFFRLHKMDVGALTVRFRAADGSIAHSVTVDGYSSQCVRRDATNGYPAPAWIYTTGYRYFQKFLPGDPRFYQHRAGSSEGANNVANPSIYIPFINRLLAGRTANRNSGQASIICRPTAFLDHTERAPLPTGDSENTQLRSYGDLYGSTDGTTKLGDVLHCRGEFWEVKSKAGEENEVTRHQFTSYSNIGESLSVQSAGGEIQIKTKDTDTTFKHELIAISTNFFCGYGNSSPSEMRPVRNVDDWLTIPRSVPLVRNLKVDQSTTNIVVSYNSVTAGGGLGAVNNKTITRNTLSFVRADSSTTPGLANTINDAMAAYFGQQSTVNAVFFTIGIRNSSSGLVLYGVQTIPLLAPFSQGVGNLPNLDLSYYLGVMFSGNIITPCLTDYLTHELASWRVTTQTEKGLQFSLVVTWTAPFSNNGWPDVDGLAALPYCYSGFLTARQTRSYSTAPISNSASAPVAGAHPDFIYEELADGRDSVYIGTGLYPVSVQVPTPLSGNDYQYAGVAGRLNNPDVLHGALRGINQEDYWTDNRDRLLQNQVYVNSPNDGSDIRHFPGFSIAQGYYLFIRMEMAAEHYNNLAAKVNSITRVKPLNWEDHGVVPHPTDLDSRLRFRSNSYGIFDRIVTRSWYASLSNAEKSIYNEGIAPFQSMRPATQYAATAEITDALYTTAQIMGIAIQTRAQLPQFALFSSKRQTSSIRVTGTVNVTDSAVMAQFSQGTVQNDPYTEPVPQTSPPTTILTTSTWKAPVTWNHTLGLTVQTGAVSSELLDTVTGTAARPDLESLDAYYWVTKDDVESYATAHGYQFFFASVGAKMELKEVQVTGATIPNVMPLPNVTVTENQDATNGPAISDPFVAFYSTRIPNPTASNLSGTRSFTITQAGILTRFLSFVSGTDWICGGTPLIESEVNADILTVQSSQTNVSLGFQNSQTVTDTGYTQTGYRFDSATSSYVKYTRSRLLNLSVSFSNTGFALQAFGLQLLTNLDEFRNFHWKQAGAIAQHAATRRTPTALTGDASVFESIEAEGGTRIEIGVQKVTEPEAFSDTSADAAKARLTFGTQVIPVTVEATGAKRVQLWADFTQSVT